MNQRLETAIATATRASHLARGVRSAWIGEGPPEQQAPKKGAPEKRALDKQDRSPVTIADFAVQSLVSLDLERHLPGDVILGEESAGALRQEDHREVRDGVVSAVQEFHPEAGMEEVLRAIDRCSADAGDQGAFWALDPIDGTKGFLRGGQYAVALALIENGEVQLGVLGCPYLPLDPAEPNGRRGCVLAAQRGGGTRLYDLDGNLRGEVSVSSQEDPAGAVFCESVEAAHSAHDLHARIAGRLGVTAPPVRMDSQCKYAALARGEGSIYLRLPRKAGYEEKIWDHAAGAMVIEEAGGRVTDAHGRDLDFGAGKTLRHNIGIVASNGRFHQQIIEAVAAEADLPK
ncbi:MAG: 3'(2'),5'-bisphosphate nucleotidase [Acidobacteriota bacterium]|nr:3'(2'),5'-bisphosphate nucleotidase [Acidobacteriota bacterium]